MANHYSNETFRNPESMSQTDATGFYTATVTRNSRELINFFSCNKWLGIILMLTLLLVTTQSVALSLSTESVSSNLPLSSGEFNVRDFGAKGDGISDDTAAFQAAVAAISTWQYPNPYFTKGTVGGGIIKIPLGKYRVSETIRYPGGIIFRGVGVGSWIDFSPTTSLPLFAPDLTRLTKPALVVRPGFENLRITGHGLGTALQLVDSGQVQLSGLTIQGFEVGLKLGHDRYTGETYYHLVQGCNISNNEINLHVGKGASQATFTGNYFWHDDAYDRADYNIIVEASNTTFIGNSIEGRPKIAQIYDLGKDTTIIGTYSETRNFPRTPFRPFLKKRLGNNETAEGNTTVIGIKNFQLLLEGWPLIASDSARNAATARRPLSLSIGNPKFLGLFANGAFRYGLYQVRHQQQGGGLSYDPNISFWNNGSLRLTRRNDNGKNSVAIASDSTFDLSPYVGQRLYLTALIKNSGDGPIRMIAYGGGNTQAKMTSEQRFRVDFGNGWRLYAVDIPVLSTSPIVLKIEQSGHTGDILHVDGLQAFVGGFDYIPAYHDVPLRGHSLPDNGTWRINDYLENTHRKIIESQQNEGDRQRYFIRGWLRISNGTGNLPGLDWVEDRAVVGG